METRSVLLALCDENHSRIVSPHKEPKMLSFDVSCCKLKQAVEQAADDLRYHDAQGTSLYWTTKQQINNIQII